MFTRDTCTYCGEVASDRDHVVPVSWDHPSRKHASWNRDSVVPSCGECNSLLSNLPYHTVGERAGYLVDRLATRYADLLEKTPEWSEEEFMELKGRLRQKVRADVRKVNVLHHRMDRLRIVHEMSPSVRDVWSAIDATEAA